MNERKKKWIVYATCQMICVATVEAENEEEAKAEALSIANNCPPALWDLRAVLHECIRPKPR